MIMASLSMMRPCLTLYHLLYLVKVKVYDAASISSLNANFRFVNLMDLIAFSASQTTWMLGDNKWFLLTISKVVNFGK